MEMESTTSLPILFISSYNSTTGVFTVPPGGDGVNYFSTYLYVSDGEYGRFNMMLNDDTVCSLYPDHFDSGDDSVPGTCSAVVDVMAGNNSSTTYNITSYFNLF